MRTLGASLPPARRLVRRRPFGTAAVRARQAGIARRSVLAAAADQGRAGLQRPAHRARLCVLLRGHGARERHALGHVRREVRVVAEGLLFESLRRGHLPTIYPLTRERHRWMSSSYGTS